jgi:transposase, IS6 family
VKGKWTFFYRAVDKYGDTIDFMLSAKRDAAAAERFFKRALANKEVEPPYAITTDKAGAYLVAIKKLKKEDLIPQTTVHRTNKYLNNIIEQDHRRIKRPLLGKGPFKEFHSACRVLKGIEAFALFRKKQAPNSLLLDIIYGYNRTHFKAA